MVSPVQEIAASEFLDHPPQGLEVAPDRRLDASEMEALPARAEPEAMLRLLRAL